MRRHWREGVSNADLSAALTEQAMGLRQPIATILQEDKRAIAYHEAGHAVATWALTEDRITRASVIRYSGGPTGGASLGHVYHVPDQERVGAKSTDIAKRICVSLAGRAAELEFLGQPHMSGGGDMPAVRRLLMGFAAEGLFSTLGYSMEPSSELVKEMDIYCRHLTDYARATLRKHADKVHALADELVAKEELDAEAVAEILGPRPGQPEATSE